MNYRALYFIRENPDALKHEKVPKKTGDRIQKPE